MGVFYVQIFKFFPVLLTNTHLSAIIPLRGETMKRLIVLLIALLSMTMLCGCSEVMQQVETVAQQIDVETVVTEVIEKIDWNELKNYAQQGYDALTEHFPALKGENIKAFLKENGLELLNKYVGNSDETMQENARKLGEIIKILNPELADEVNSVIAE